MRDIYQALKNYQGRFGIWGVAGIVVVGILLMVLPGMWTNKQEYNKLPESTAGIAEKLSTSYNSSLTALEELLNAEVSEVLSQVAGAGKVAVTVRLEGSTKKEYVLNTADDKSTVEERDSDGGIRIVTEESCKKEVAFAQKDGEPLVFKEVSPRIEGVLIVADGAGDGEVKENLGKAVQAMLGVPAHRIIVLPRERR